jgi:hypothetical protein
VLKANDLHTRDWFIKEISLAKICDGPMFHVGTTGNGGDDDQLLTMYMCFCTTQQTS